MSAAELMLVAAAGFVAGVVNAIAGGGSLVSFPALLAIGYPTVTANVTNSVSLWPGYASSIAPLRPPGRRRCMREFGVTASAGGVVGVVLLLALPGSIFDAAVPWRVLFASSLLAAQSRLSTWLRRRSSRSEGESR